MNHLRVEIISVEGCLLSQECYLVSIPAALGEMGIMYGHESLVTTLNAGEIKIYASENEVSNIFLVEGGVAEMKNPSTLSIIVDGALVK